MAKVVGVGGIFFKSDDPETLTAWYKDVLGLPSDQYGFIRLPLSEPGPGHDGGCEVISPFKADTDYFAPSDAPFMINFRVDDLDGMLAKLAEAGATLVGEPMDEPYGKFGWVLDPDGNKIELWEPKVMEEGSFAE